MPCERCGGDNHDSGSYSCPYLRPSVKLTAENFLRDAGGAMAARAAQYDSPEGERSMGKTVAAFNAITGRDLTETEGWLLMLVLKQVRQFQAVPRLDSATDSVAFAALLAESRMKEPQS